MVLTNDRLTLRLHQPEDLPFIRTFFSDPDVIEFICEGYKIPDEKLEDFVHRTSGISNEEQKWLFTALDNEEQKLIGCAMFKFDEDLGDYQFGFGLMPQYRGSGYGRLMAQLLVDFGFDELALPKMLAVVDTNNENSIAVLEKIGMSFLKPYEHDDRTDFIYQIEK